MDPWQYLLEVEWPGEPAVVLDVLKLAILGGQDQLDELQLSEAAGVELSTTRQLWRAMGFPDAVPGTKAFTGADLEALRRVGAALASRGEETLIERARVLSSLLARAADVVATGLVSDVAGYQRAGLAETDAAAAAVVQLHLLEISALVDYVFRRQLVTALTRYLTADSKAWGSTEVSVAVMFADLVGFTALSQQLEADDLSVLVTRFQSLAFDLVARSGGRVVKTLGDEVMVVCEDIDTAMDLATVLAQTYANDEFLPDVRVGMAFGPVLTVQGDYFGSTVNLASRLVGVAEPGAVVISDAARRALSTESRFLPSELPPRRLKGIGWTVCWAVEPPSVTEFET